ncbi:MAG: segregation/condensation protein A [Cyanobacteriota bacterium]|nr:segregation/condensation protein A [Cyanobacteriota bacterium]
MLQDAAERGEIDPWDVDVIAVIDGFLDKLHQRISAPSLSLAQGTRFEQDLAESSEAFLAASVLVGLKAELLERTNVPPPEADESFFLDQSELESDHDLQIPLPLRPERQLLRRPVAPPPLQRPVSLGELIRQLEEIAERLERDERRPRQRGNRRFSERMVIAQVAALAHREKLPETTAALNAFIQSAWPGEDHAWLGFDALVDAWGAWTANAPEDDLDRDRVGVFWALLFLSSQGKLELHQHGGLFGPLSLRRLLTVVGTTEGEGPREGSASLPAPGVMAA